MKYKIYSFAVLVFFISACRGKKENEGQSLRRRFSGFVNAIAEKNTDSIRYYTYPRIFTLLDPNESDQVIARSYSLLNTKGTTDSIRIDTLSPIENIDNGNYALAIYSLSMKIKVDTPVRRSTPQPPDSNRINHSIDDTYPAPQATLMTTLMRSFNVVVSDSKEENGLLWMHIRVITIAAKDEFSKEWSFYTLTEDQETPNKLFPKKILEKLFSKKVLEELLSYNNNE